MPDKGKFKRCVESVSERGGVSDPRAVCAASIAAKRGRTRGRVNLRGRQRWGIYERMHDGRDLPLRIGFATEEAASEFLGKKQDQGEYSYLHAIIRPYESAKRRRTRGRVNAGKARHPGVSDLKDMAATAVKAKIAGPLVLLGNPSYSDSPDMEVRAKVKEGKHAYSAWAYYPSLLDFNDRLRELVEDSRLRGRRYQWKIDRKEGGKWRHFDFDTGRIRGGRSNPTRRNHHNEPAAIEAYKDFHGREPDELIEGETKYHYPGRTAAIGELISLKIRVPAGRVEGGRVVTVKNFDGAMLTRHPTEVQLYIELGDQSLDLEEFGITGQPHAVEYLGHLVEVTYYTVKDHLGREGGEANYVHRFGVNEATGEKTECPRVNYRVADEQIEFSGGGYTIPPEGIDG